MSNQLFSLSENKIYQTPSYCVHLSSYLIRGNHVCLESRGKCCKDLIVSESMLSKFNKQMYDFKKITATEEEEADRMIVEVCPGLD